MLIIWLQGIWLPLHGYDYAQTPLWAGIYLLSRSDAEIAAMRRVKSALDPAGLLSPGVLLPR
jgi:FAD/FMN-containing dehydrogenase